MKLLILLCIIGVAYGGKSYRQGSYEPSYSKYENEEIYAYGPPGPQGEPGPQGKPGPQGPKGAPGPAGKSSLGQNCDTVPLTALENRKRFSATDFKFDLAGSNPNVVGEGGTGRRASVVELPSLKGVGISSVLFQIDPCAINLPHIHPRATELFFVVEGQFQTGFLEENEGRLILNNLTQGETTFFPQGLVHFEQNLGCTPATFLSAFNHEDPGVLTLPNRLFDIPIQALTSSFNNDPVTLEKIKKRLVSNPASGVGECRARCGI